MKELEGKGEPLVLREDLFLGHGVHKAAYIDPRDSSRCVKVVFRMPDYDLMKETARYYKETPEGVEIMCKAFEKTRNEKAIRIAKNMIEKGKYDLEEIAEVTELPLEKVQELAGKKTA